MGAEQTKTFQTRAPAFSMAKQTRLSHMFPGESMEQVTQCSGEHNTLSHDFVIVERVYHNDKIKIGVLIEPAMNKRAASEKGVNLRSFHHNHYVQP